MANIVLTLTLYVKILYSTLILEHYGSQNELYRLYLL
jgi:hypothetical protein